MMKFIQAILPLCLSALAVASPTATLDKRATTICGQWDSVTTGTYTVYQDLWGESSATSGSQCTTVTSDASGTLVWSTSWTWAGGSSSVKSYANAAVSFTSQQLSAISSIPSTWEWSYTGANIVADVSYDMFTSSTSGGSSDYEVMVWLAAIGGAGPISSTGSPVSTGVTIDGVTFNLYSGYNGSTRVFSFVAESDTYYFSGDILNFFKYLESNQGLSSSQYLTSIGAGTEPFTGTSAVFSSSAYSIVVN